MAFSKLKQFFLGGSDPHAERAAPDYNPMREPIQSNAVGPDVSRRDERGEAEDEEWQGSTTPPQIARTDRGRGTGELGAEQIDPGEPLAQ